MFRPYTNKMAGESCMHASVAHFPFWRIGHAQPNIKHWFLPHTNKMAGESFMHASLSTHVVILR